jgi:lysophospholipase L1-like esterase
MALAFLGLAFLAPRIQGATDTAATFANVARKLRVDKKLVIGYIGGSITAGGGISTAGTDSWRALTTAWFKKAYPVVAITEINASISSTGSDLAAFRCTRDLTSRKPDLVFIEFSVNDWQDSKAGIQPYAEGLIRNILLKNPNAGIADIPSRARP